VPVSELEVAVTDVLCGRSTELLGVKKSGTYSMSLPKAYDEIVDFIAAGSTPLSVSEFHPSVEARNRVVDLVAARSQIR
jgi:hypothetical protein